MENEKDFYKELAYFELERKEKIIARVQIPLTLIILLWGGIFYGLNNINQTTLNLRWLLIVLLIISAVSLVFSAYYLYKSLHGYTYSYPPLPSAIQDYKKELIDYYQTNISMSIEELNVSVTKDMNEYLIDRYVEMGDKNTKVNDKKSFYLVKCLYSIGFSLVFLATFFVLYFIIIFE